MKKLSLPVMLFLSMTFSFSIYSQELPNFTPPSPEASEITKYGGLPINESTGKASLNVPIYAYKAGQVEVPIAMNYIGNGVKVNAPNTWTGVNWTLDAGGLISRTINDQIDELVTQRIFQAEIDALGLQEGLAITTSNPANDAGTLRGYFEGNNWDTEPDIFNFSFGGYSGSFYLNESFVPVLITADKEIQIEISNGNTKQNLVTHQEFIITTPDGSKYYFGGSQAIESTHMVYGPHTTVQSAGVTGYYLTKIEHPINGKVYFEYSTVSAYDINMNFMHSAQLYLHKLSEGGNPFPPDFCQMLSGEGKSPSASPTVTRNEITNGRFLSRIYSPDNLTEEVVFNSSNTINGQYNFERVLESIQVNRIQPSNPSEILHKFDFEYLYDYDDGIAQRFFLESIKFDRDLSPNNNYRKYEFIYEDPLGLPKRFSYALDHYGYYNGQDNNEQGILPNYNHSINQYTEHANRGFSFGNSLKGALTKVIYPTGGSTEIQYEPSYKKKFTYAGKSIQTFVNDYPLEGSSGGYHIDDPTAYFTLGGVSLEPMLDQFGEPIYDENGVQMYYENGGLEYSQEIDLHLVMKSVSQVSNQNHKVTVRITNLSTNPNTVVYENEFPFPNPGGPDFIFRDSISYSFNKDYLYQIDLELPTNPSAPAMTATLSCQYKNGVAPLNAGGLRVKRVIDKPKDSIETNIKRYYYRELKDIYKDSLDVVDFYEEPSYLRSTNLLIETGAPCGDFLTLRTESHPGLILESTPTNNTNEHLINTFDSVLISFGGDNFEEGGVAKRFEVEQGYVVSVFKNSRINTTAFKSMQKTNMNANWLFLKNGKLKQETYLTKKMDTIYAVQKEEKLYTNNSSTPFYGFVGSFFFEYGPGFDYPYNNVGLGKYEIRTREIVPSQVKKTDYIDPFPVAWESQEQEPIPNPYVFHGWPVQDHDNDGVQNWEDEDYLALIEAHDENNPVVDESNYRKVVTTTNYEYNGIYAGQPTKVTSTSSVAGETLETRNYYVNDAGNLANLDSNLLPHYQTLMNQNRVGSPIQTESYKNKNGVLTKLSTQRTLYSNASGDVLPSILQYSKSHDDLEDRVVFEEYDQFGRVVKVKLKDGSITKYTYNGLNQVLKKIENFTSEDFTVDMSGTDCEDNDLIYEGALVTLFYYDSLTHKISHITDPSCNTIYYEYDELHRLKYIKDRDGNILSEYEYNFQMIPN